MPQPEILSSVSRLLQSSTDVPRPSPPQPLQWSPLHAGDSPAHMLSWKRASAATEGDGLLLVRGLQKLVSRALPSSCSPTSSTPSAGRSAAAVPDHSSQPDSDLGSTCSDSSPVRTSDTTATNSTAASASNRATRPCPPPHYTPSSSSSSLTLSSSVRGCDVGVALLYLERMHTGATPDVRERMKWMMHVQMSDRLFTAEVRRAASAAEIAAVFALDSRFVARHWVVSEQDGDRKRRREDCHGVGTRHGRGGVERWSPESEDLTPRYDADPNTRGMALETQLEIGLSRPVESRVLALALTKVGKEEEARENALCGFATAPGEHCHPSLNVSCSGHLVERVPGVRGLYHTIRTRSGLNKAEGRPIYFEFHLLSKVQGAAVCVGLSSAALETNKLLGATPCSVGYHSSGNLVTRNQWSPYGAEINAGDTIGCLIQMRAVYGDRSDNERIQIEWMGEGASAIEKDQPPTTPRGTFADVSFFRNGAPLGTAVQSLFVANLAELYPTVSMFREGSQVELRCCSENVSISGVSLPDNCVALCSGLPLNIVE